MGRHKNYRGDAPLGSRLLITMTAVTLLASSATKKRPGHVRGVVRMGFGGKSGRRQKNAALNCLGADIFGAQSGGAGVDCAAGHFCEFVFLAADDVIFGDERCNADIF